MGHDKGEWDPSPKRSMNLCPCTQSSLWKLKPFRAQTSRHLNPAGDAPTRIESPSPVGGHCCLPSAGNWTSLTSGWVSCHK